MDSRVVDSVETGLSRFIDLPVGDAGEPNQYSPGDGLAGVPAVVGAVAPKVRYTHQGMAEYILANPWASQDQIAAYFGYSASWISTIICSEAFQALLAKRRDELIDPVLRHTIKEQLDGILARSLEILRVKLSKPAASIPDNLVLQAAKVAAQAAGYGARTQDAPPVSPVNIEVHLTTLSEKMVGLLRRQKGQIISADVLGETQDLENLHA